MGFWDGKVVLITGGTRGIGLALAEGIAPSNASLILTARSKEELEKASSSLPVSVDNLFLFPADVSDDDSVKRLMVETFNKFGRIDIVINNAGVGLRGKVCDINPDDLERAFKVNLFGPLNMVQQTVPIFKMQGQGTIVNICSLGAVRPVPNIGGYSASKAALMSLMQTARLELQPLGIKVINVFPGSAKTGFRDNALGVSYPENEPRLSRVSPDLVASRIISGIEGGKNNIFITWPDKAMAFISGAWPGLADKLVFWAFRRKKG
jgi:short-subunit dehydrogenase